MKRMLLLSSVVVALLGCSSSSAPAPAPVISKLTIASPIKSGVQTMGSLEVSDTAGLAGLSLDFAITGPAATMFSSPVQGGSAMETEAMVPFAFLLEGPGGTYSVAVTVTEGGATSNVLKTTVVLQ